MSVITKQSSKPPSKSPLVDDQGFISRIWLPFFQKITASFAFLGEEYFFDLVNNQAGAADVTGLAFDLQYTSGVVIDYLIQRTTSTTELIQLGRLRAVYRPKTLTWSIYDPSPSGDAGGIVFSITSTGQVQYTSTNVGGTPVISKLTYRTRALAAKNSLYSKIG